MNESELIARYSLHPNGQKQTELHPDLKGVVALGGVDHQVAIWSRETMKRDRIYHSCTIRKPYQKGRSEQPAPIVKACKLYEFQRKGLDPDYQSTQPVQILGVEAYLAMWVTIGGPDSMEDMEFVFCILKHPYTAEISSQAADTLASIRERLAVRNRELGLDQARISQVTPSIDEEPDDIPLNELGEPTDIPKWS